MSKIVVPKEQEKQIVDLYNSGKTRKAIKQELNLPFGDSVIKRILIENNIEIRTNPGAQAGGRKKEEIPREFQDKIVSEYLQGKSREALALQERCSDDKIKRILLENNIQIRDSEEARKYKKEVELRKFFVNDDYDFNSHNGAWILGFIAADGYLPIGHGSHNRIVISLAKKDRDVLELISKELEYTGTIKDYVTAEGHEFSSLNFTSKRLRKKIESYGIANNKTFLLQGVPKNLSQEYVIDFIRGFFDGDGCVFEPKGKKINIGLTCASKKMIESIANNLQKILGVSYPSIHVVVRAIAEIYDIRYYTKDSFIIGNAFYNNDYLALPRKKNHFLQIKEKYS